MRGHHIVGAFIVLVFVFVPMERLFALRREQKILRRDFANDLLHFFVNHALVGLGLAVTATIGVYALDGLVSPTFQAAVASQPRALQIVEALVIAELTFYGVHRMAHTIPFLWRFHAVHHSIEEMDWLAAARLHPIDQIWSRTMVILPLYLMGFTLHILGGYVAIAAFQAIFIHANVRFRFGPLRYVFATPEFHHWHHSADAVARDKNFAGQLPLLDWLFGTLHLPHGERPTRYGVDQRMPHRYLAQLAYPFSRSDEH